MRIGAASGITADPHPVGALRRGSALPPETYTTAGDYFYVREIPASLLTGDSLRVDFQLDKAMPPSSADIRELGIIVLTHFPHGVGSMLMVACVSSSRIETIFEVAL